MDYPDLDETSTVIGHAWGRVDDPEKLQELDTGKYVITRVGADVIVWCRIESYEGFAKTDRGDPAGRLRMHGEERIFVKAVSGIRYIPQLVETMPAAYLSVIVDEQEAPHGL